MVRHILPLAVLAMSPGAYARFPSFGGLFARQDASQCPPCPGAVTVTQIQQAPPQTVTVNAQPQTVYVTQGGNPTQQPGGPAQTQVVTVQPQPESPQQQQQQTVTVVQGQSEQAQPSVVTQTAQPETVQQPAGPKTVTVNQQGETQGGTQPQVVTIVNTPQQPTVVTVTANPSPEVNSQAQPQPQGPQTVYVTHQPQPEKVGATVTAPPQTIVKSVDNYQTLTKTVAGGGGDNIEIIIVNIYTGEMSCRKKHSGKPCDTSSHTYIPPAASGSSGIPCPVLNATTSVATAYNTVFVTVTGGTNSTAPSGTGSPMMTMMARHPHAPRLMRKW